MDAPLETDMDNRSLTNMSKNSSRSSHPPLIMPNYAQHVYQDNAFPGTDPIINDTDCNPCLSPAPTIKIPIMPTREIPVSPSPPIHYSSCTPYEEKSLVPSLNNGPQILALAELSERDILSCDEPKGANKGLLTEVVDASNTNDESTTTPSQKTNAIVSEFSEMNSTASTISGGHISYSVTSSVSPKKAKIAHEKNISLPTASIGDLNDCVLLEENNDVFPLITLVGEEVSSVSIEELATMPVAFAFNLGDAESEKKAKENGIKWGKKITTGRKPTKSRGSRGGKSTGKRTGSIPTLVFSGPAPDIGIGWTVKRYERMGGHNKGRCDRYWYSPINEFKFRSTTEVTRFKTAMAQVDNDEKKAYKLTSRR